MAKKTASDVLPGLAPRPRLLARVHADLARGSVIEPVCVLIAALRFDVTPESDRDQGVDLEANAVEICQHVGYRLTGFTDLLRGGGLHLDIASVTGARRLYSGGSAAVESGGASRDGEGV